MPQLSFPQFYYVKWRNTWLFENVQYLEGGDFFTLKSKKQNLLTLIRFCLRRVRFLTWNLAVWGAEIVPENKITQVLYSKALELMRLRSGDNPVSQEGSVYHSPQWVKPSSTSDRFEHLVYKLLSNPWSDITRSHHNVCGDEDTTQHPNSFFISLNANSS